MRRSSWAWRLVAVLAALGLALGLAACGDDDSGAGGPVTLRLAYVTTAQHPYGLAVDYFANEVKTASEGRITIETLPSYGGDIPLLDDVSGGTVDMGSISSAVWDTKGVKSFQALQAPFLITTPQVEEQVITGSIAEEMLEGVDQLNLVGLAIHEGGFRKPLGRDKALLTPADFRGLKIRAPESGVLAAGLRALGAEPTPLPVTDVYLALKEGAVDGMEANLGLIYTNKYNEVAKFVTQNVNLWPFPTVLVMNKDKFNDLSDEDQQIIRDAAAKVPGFSIKIFTEPDPNAVNFAVELCNAGLKFAFATPADQAALATAAETAITSLSEDEQVAGFIDQIKEIKANTPAPPAPPPLPDKCVV